MAHASIGAVCKLIIITTIVYTAAGDACTQTGYPLWILLADDILALENLGNLLLLLRLEISH